MAKHSNGKKTSSALGFWIALFFLMFIGFMVWYFVICSQIAVAPSDWALVTIGAVCAVECIAAAVIKTRKAGTVTEQEKSMVEFGARVVASALNIQPPAMQSGVYGTQQEERTEDEEFG